MEEEDFYLCHWTILSSDDLIDLDDNDIEIIIYQIQMNLNPTEGHKFRIKLIEAKLIQDFKQVVV